MTGPLSPLLTVLVPSRGRPANLERLVEAVGHTTERGTSVRARIDLDDPKALEYSRIPSPNLTLNMGHRVHFAASVNELAAVTQTPFLAVLGDDVLPETDGWDRILIDALGGRLGIAYGSDGLEDKHGVDLPTHVVMPREIFERLGWVALPLLRHLFVDNVWRELGKGLGNLAYVPEVKLTHLHPWAKRSEMDQTYREANDGRARAIDRWSFEAWRDGDGLRLALERLREEP